MIQNTLLFCTLTPFVLGFASAFETRDAVKSKWYQNVKKPWFNPPRYVFAPIWTYLYLSTGYALYLVKNTISENSSYFSSLGVYLFWSQLLANLLWSNLYFVQREIDLALYDMIFLTAVSVITMICFYSVSSLAGLMMIPYLTWAIYATALTNSVKNLNPDFKNELKTQ